MYSLPVDSPEEWLTWETPNDLPSSQNIDAEVTEEGLKLSFADTATQQIPVAFVRNISGLAKVEKGDKLVLNATLEGDAGGMDIRWRFQLQFAGAGVNIVVSKYVGEAAGLAANEYGQLPQGDYNVVLDIEQLLKDYDEDNNLTGADSTYEKVFGENGYLSDTHTAVAVNVYEQYTKETGDTTPCIIASTASPYKFAPAVLPAVYDGALPEDEFAMTETLFATTGLPIPAPIASLRGKKVLHPAAIEKSCMSEFIREFLK